MSKDKQIKEMAEAIEQARIKATDTTNSMNYGFGGWYAKELYAKGDRKVVEQSETARECEKTVDKRFPSNVTESVTRAELAEEIFAELLKDITHRLEIARCTRRKTLNGFEFSNLWLFHYDGEIKALEGMECVIAELKKKYTEEGK